MSRRRWKIWLATLAVGVVAGYSAWALTSTFLSAWVFGYGQGNAAYAETWRQRLEPLPDPEQARDRYPEVASKKFDNGEWIFGICDDSHGSHWGGTIVVKDSTGHVRAFFGHVCGPRALEGFFSLDKSGSVEEFYASKPWKVHNFQEYNLQ